MATTENQALLEHKNENGDLEILYPINRMEDVVGLPEAVARLEENQAGAAAGGSEAGTIRIMKDNSIVHTTASAVTTTTKTLTPEGWKKITERIVYTDTSKPTIVKTIIIKVGSGNVATEIVESYEYENS